MSEEVEHHKCLIIGSGPAGYTAAIYAARADMKPVLYQGNEPGGQLMITTDVENYPGYPEGVLGPAMMEDLKKQAERFDTDVRFGFVTSVDFSGSPHKVVIDEKKTITADSIIISTGASANWLGLESEMRLRDNGGGVSACAVCDGFFYKNQEVALIGGGDSACEEASYLSKLCTKVYMLVRKDHFRASKIMQKRVLENDKIEVLFNHEVREVLGDDAVTGMRVINNISNEEREIAITGFFVAIGHKPNTDIFKDILELDDVGYIIHQPDTAATNIEGVFVSGDAADSVYRQAVTAAGTGCMAALDAESWVAGFRSLESMLADESKLKYVTFLSGDVHYSFARTAMLGNRIPAVQLTSSPLHNTNPGITIGDENKLVQGYHFLASQELFEGKHVAITGMNNIAQVWFEGGRAKKQQLKSTLADGTLQELTYLIPG